MFLQTSGPCVLFCSFLISCAPKVSPEAQQEQEESEIQPRTTQLLDDGMLEERIDLNGDGFFDVTSICIPKEGGQESSEDGQESSSVLDLTCRFEAIMVRKEIDLNWDGKIDRVRHYENGELLRIVNDGDFDGNFEWTDYYQGGTLVLTEKDPDGDGEIEIYKNYQAGRLARIRRDTDGDNVIDLWEYFGPDGQIDKIGLDVDQDGIMDIRRE